MKFETRRLSIGNNYYDIIADRDYAKHLGEYFEPNTIALYKAFCDPDMYVLDIGANIGVTAIALSQLCPEGKVAAIEPVPEAFKMLTENIMHSGHDNISLHNYALGSINTEISMQGNPNNFSGSFVSDKHEISDGVHFRESVKQKKLDDIFPSFNFDRLDLIKIDVEGYELDIFKGATQLLNKYQPVVLLEMNYVALNLWREMSLPEFRRRLLDMFPFVYAVQNNKYLDFRDKQQSHIILFEHLTKWHYMDLVAGFDKDDLVARLNRLTTS